MKGYVRIHREITDHWLWEEKPFSYGQAWVDLILLANYKTEKFLYRNRLVEGERGTVYRSIKWLSDRWGWNRKKTSKFLSLLEGDGMVTTNGTPHGTTITIVNYGKFQDRGTANGTPEGQKMGHKRDTYNKDKKINKNKYVNFEPSGTDWDDLADQVMRSQ